MSYLKIVKTANKNDEFCNRKKIISENYSMRTRCFLARKFFDFCDTVKSTSTHKKDVYICKILENTCQELRNKTEFLMVCSNFFSQKQLLQNTYSPVVILTVLSNPNR